MSRYFVQRTRSAAWIEDEYLAPDPSPMRDVFVPEHIATDTGLVDLNGDPIMHAPRPVGFGRAAEW